jgi:hypothetical protein
MEDVLEVYGRPYDPDHPVICLDERSKALRSTPRGGLPAGPGSCRREDYEYERTGVCNIFLWVEPLAGRRGVQVTERRTAVDFAEQLRELVDVAKHGDVLIRMRRLWATRVRNRLIDLWRCAARNDGEFRQTGTGAAAAGDERDVQFVVEVLAAGPG